MSKSTDRLYEKYAESILMGDTLGIKWDIHEKICKRICLKYKIDVRGKRKIHRETSDLLSLRYIVIPSWFGGSFRYDEDEALNIKKTKWLYNKCKIGFNKYIKEMITKNQT